MDDITKLLQMQALQVPPDQQQMQTVPNAQGIPFYLQAQNTPAQASVPQSPGAEMAPAMPKASRAPGPIASNYLDKPTEEGLFAQYGEASKRAQDDQEKGLGALQDYINSIANKPSGINFTPLAAYIDSQVPGSKLTEAAKQMAPMSDEDRDKQLFDLQNKLQGDRGALSNARTKSLGDQLLAMRQERHQTEAERHNRAMEEGQAERNKNMGANGGMVGVRMGNQAIMAGKDFENSPIVRTGKQSLSSLARAVSILRNADKPLTAKDLALAYNDYINSVDSAGKATEGKVHRELPETFEQKLNEVKQSMNINADIRKTAAGKELVDMLEKNMHTVRHDIGIAISDQAADIATTYGAVNNPLVHQTVAAKKARYEDAERNSKFAQPREEHATAAPADLNAMSDDELHKLWMQKKGK